MYKRQALGCSAETVFVSSTGVIGVPLPKDRARAGVEAVLSAEPCSWEDAARAIGTTDTFTKGAGAHAMLGDTRAALVDSATAVNNGVVIPIDTILAPDPRNAADQ